MTTEQSYLVMIAMIAVWLAYDHYARGMEKRETELKGNDSLEGKVALKAGTEITCTNGHYICKVGKDIKYGSYGAMDKLIEYAPGTIRPGAHTKPTCIECGADWIRPCPLGMHTKDGWPDERE